MEETAVRVNQSNHFCHSNNQHHESVQSVPKNAESETLFEIEEEEEEKAKWLLPAIYAVCLNVFPFSIKTEQRKICSAHHISTSMPRYLVLNVFII
jgi:hypothetical protein